MYLKTLETHVLEYTNLILPFSFSAPGLIWQAALKKTKVRVYLLTDIYMLLMVEKDIRGGICHSIYWYTKANKKYVKDYDKNKESSYLQYWDVTNLSGWAMMQKASSK